ncbi:MAG: hypothetical protein LIP16_01965 [Clostridium sp.]|nr:hypothetical protein [Clostridium sp.]
MPAYFNLSVQFRRDELYPTFVKDFYTMLDEAGMKFQSGYWGFEEDSLEETIQWNQRKLEEDFNLGFTEHHSHDYKQVIYRFGAYSEVRGFWMNNYPEDGEFTYEIIIPESEVLMEGYPVRFIKKKMDRLLELSEGIWQFPPVRAIQTGLEIEDDSAGLAELAQGGCPSAWPFAIVEELGACYEGSMYDIRLISGGKRGLLFWRTGTDNG